MLDQFQGRLVALCSARHLQSAAQARTKPQHHCLPLLVVIVACLAQVCPWQFLLAVHRAGFLSGNGVCNCGLRTRPCPGGSGGCKRQQNRRLRSGPCPGGSRGCKQRAWVAHRMARAWGPGPALQGNLLKNVLALPRVTLTALLSIGEKTKSARTQPKTVSRGNIT